jgi:hypothetical protein
MSATFEPTMEISNLMARHIGPMGTLVRLRPLRPAKQEDL